MSTTFRAYAGIGVMIPREKLFRNIPRRCCTHVPGGAPFCSQCGQPIWRDSLEPIPEFTYHKEPAMLAGLHVQKTQDREAFLVSPSILEAKAGWPEPHAQVRGVLSPSTYMTAYLTCIHALQPLGLWDESAFGLWCLAVVS